jgi:hypothetical protein
MASARNIRRLHYAETPLPPPPPQNTAGAVQPRPERLPQRARFVTGKVAEDELGDRQGRPAAGPAGEARDVAGSYMLPLDRVLHLRLQANVASATASCGGDRGDFGSLLIGNGHR